MLRQSGGNWVDGNRFFGRVVELGSLQERVNQRRHTLLTAQRRMGKTSLIRELLRRLDARGDYSPIFVDLEGTRTPEDAIAEIGVRCRGLRSTWQNLLHRFGGLSNQVEELGVSDLRIRLRTVVNSQNWMKRGDQLFEILAAGSKPAVLAIDELALMVAGMLNGDEFASTPTRKNAAGQFLSWLRKNGQEHRDRVSIIISGSIGLQPLLEQAGLSSLVSIFSPLKLEAWTADEARSCLKELAATDSISLPQPVLDDICRRLRCCVPHHVQEFYFHIFEELQRTGTPVATAEHVERIYRDEMLGMSGQAALHHYEARLASALGPERYWIARELLTEAAINGGKIDIDSITAFKSLLKLDPIGAEESVRQVLRVLEHDGYLAYQDGEYRYVSGLLEDWWRKSHGRLSGPSRGRS